MVTIGASSVGAAEDDREFGLFLQRRTTKEHKRNNTAQPELLLTAKKIMSAAIVLPSIHSIAVLSTIEREQTVCSSDNR